MAIYEYECLEDNQHVFEYSQKISDPSVPKCVYCGGDVRRLISKTAFQLKGAGWYATDYRSSNCSAKEPVGSAKKPPVAGCNQSACNVSCNAKTH